MSHMIILVRFRPYSLLTITHELYLPTASTPSIMTMDFPNHEKKIHFL